MIIQAGVKETRMFTECSNVWDTELVCFNWFRSLVENLSEENYPFVVKHPKAKSWNCGNVTSLRVLT